LENKKSLKSN